MPRAGQNGPLRGRAGTSTARSTRAIFEIVLGPIERRRGGVLRRDKRRLERPLYAYCRVRVVHGTFRFGRVDIGALVEDERSVLQSNEAVREPRRNPERKAVLGRQSPTHPLTEGRRPAQEADREVEDRSGNTAHSLV